MIVQSAAFSKTVNPRNIDKSVSDNRILPVPVWKQFLDIRIRFQTHYPAGYPPTVKPDSDHLCGAVLPALRFSREFGFVFLWSCVFFKTCRLLVFGLVLIEICLIFGLVFFRFLLCRLLFFQILWHFCCFNLLLKATWACFCENVLKLGLFFGFATLNFYLIFLLIFCFIEFSCQRILGLYFG